MFDLQSLSRNHRRPDWISTANMIQLEQTAKSVEYLWSKRNIFSYPQSNVVVDSSGLLYCDLNRGHENLYIEECEMENIIAFNDLLPPLKRSGELSHLYGYNLKRSLPQNNVRMEPIQVHIQFTDRVHDVIQKTMQQSNDYNKYLKYKRKKRRLRELSASNSNIRQSKRIRNRLHREIYSQDNDDDEAEAVTTRKKAVSEDSVSSMSITPEISNKNSKKRKLTSNGSECEPMPKRKKRKIAIIDNDVIGDSEQDEEEDADDVMSLDGVSNSLIYEIALDDLKLDFFIRLFPQLLATHHLVYCKHSYQHYYYQNYFSAANNKYEWIQTDMQLLNLYHRYIDDHFETETNEKNMDRSRYNDHQNRRIVLFFQIRPRSDTKSDEECIQHHKQLLMDNLIEMNEMRKKKKEEQEEKEEEEEEDTFYIDGDVTDEDEDDDATNYNHWSQDKLVTNVIKAIHEQENGNCAEYEYKYNIAGSYESGLCGFCQKKFSTNKRSEEKWIECEFCRKWYHVMCSGLSSKDFIKFQSKQNDKNNKYKCLMCAEK